MKTKILILCVIIGFGIGCRKETAQADRYKVFSASWEELSDYTRANGQIDGGIVTRKELIKIDSATGRVWFWSRERHDAKDQSGWVEMTDSGYVLPASLQPQKH